jgi:cytoskeletal protein CcmA (bactofilin family)
MLRIDGHFAGHVDSDEGTLIVSNGAQVSHAVINVAVAKINGTVEGDINATKELVLGPTANVTGNISARLLTVQEGALLNGGCVLLPSTETEKFRTVQSKHRSEKK